MEQTLFGGFITFIITSILKIFDALGLIDVLYYSGKLKPYRKYPGDAGYDIRSKEYTEVLPHSGVDVSIDTSITSRRMWLLMVGRSSTFHCKGLLTNTAIIDRDYCGHLNIYVYNMTNKKVLIQRGERIGQVIPIRLERMVLFKGVFRRKGGRGNRGYGSTGKF